MGLEPVIVEISSDEEACGLKESNASGCSELNELIDGETAESDDVVILDEFPSTSGENFASSRRRNRPFREGRDDDFVVLDSDPDNVVSPFTGSREGDGSDELHIIGEKGQVACRDYPHSRDLCANFPFSSTPHEKHCNLIKRKGGKPKGILSRKGAMKHSILKGLLSNETRHSQGPPNACISSMPAHHKPEPTQTVPLVITASTLISHPLQPCPATSFQNQNTIGQKQNQHPVDHSYGGQSLSQPWKETLQLSLVHKPKLSGLPMVNSTACGRSTAPMLWLLNPSIPKKFQRIGLTGVKGTSFSHNQKSSSANQMQNSVSQMYQCPVSA